MTQSLGRLTAALACGTMLAMAAPASAQTIRYVPDADLRVLDPIFTTAGTTLNHAVMIYDFLLAPDGKNQPQPQMLESWKASPDGLTYSFKLRPNQKWHDGTPVTAKDAVASLKRWGAKVPSGRDTFTRIADVATTGTDTFDIKLNKPFGRLIAFLAEPINPPFIMREVDANTDPNTAITTTIGSGPFKFVREEWMPGSKVGYAKNTDYVPRPEKAEHMAGGKVVKVDKVEWVILPDTNTAANALGAGEVDYLENPLIDMLPTLRKNPNVVVQVVNPLGYQMILRPNHLVPPFDNVKVRQALLYAVEQTTYLQAAVGDPDLRKPCWAILICGGPYETTAGLGEWAKPGSHMEKAKQLLKESGYKGERVVVMHPTDQTVIGSMSLVTAAKLKEAGFNVDMQATDWATLISRRPVRESPEVNRGGWNIFHTWGFAGSLMEPLTSSFIATPCDGKNWFGWPCDAELEKLRMEFEAVTSPEEGRKAAERYQTRFYETVPLVPLGQFTQPVAYRSNLSGILTGTRVVLWNIEKK
jgi:peptide/nickel transport system substrate-binding protein